MQRALQQWLPALALVLAASVNGWAQSTAQISGTVKDESGGVLPGATVTVTQMATGFSRTVVTDENGFFVLPNLPIGPYRLEVSLSGFRTYQQTGLVLQVNSSPVINVVLALGALEESVTVEAASPLVETRNPGVGTVVENERILALPLDGRQVTDLILVSGAAVQPDGAAGRSSSRSMQGGVAISVAGGQTWGVAYLLDGAMHNNPYDNHNLPLPFPDATEEFRVETGALSAQSGVHAGATVNVVTKSGTNAFHGDFFEFFRDHRLNATNAFAAVGPDGKRKSDGLKRHQVGATLGGPIRRDKIHFFGGYQGTFIRQVPVDNIAFVPTAAVLAGDWTMMASPACNAGRQITLRPPFVNNRIDPALYSRAALNIAAKLPKTDDPCGRVVYGVSEDEDNAQWIGRIDYQWNPNRSLFGRYMATSHFNPPAFSQSDNILTTTNGGRDNLAQSLTFGDTWIIGPGTVNALRFAFNRTAIHRTPQEFFSGREVGINMYDGYLPRYMILTVSGAFSIGGGTENEARFNTNTYQISDDLTLVRGDHQISMGINVAYWKSFSTANVRSPGTFSFDGQVTGLPLADFLTGNVATFIQAAPNVLDMDQRYLGLYAQDTWRLSDRVTLNYGLRWEPFFPQQIRNGYVYNFSLEKFRQGVRSTVYRNAPPGFSYPGDPDFIGGKSGMHRQWANLAPRVGIAWDVRGDGRFSIRSSYGRSYDFVNAQFHLNTSIAPPWGFDVRRPRVSLDDPWAGYPGGNPFPIQFDANAPFPAFGQFLALNPDMKTARVDSWSLSVQRQFGANWLVSASYLGNYASHLWNMKALNPGVFLGLGPCTIETATGPVFYPVCSTTANLNQRRRLSLERPREAQAIGALDMHDDSGWQRYHGLLVSIQRRVGSGLTVNANHTWSKCVGLPNQQLPNQSTGWLDPEKPDFDRGPCDTDKRHIFNLTVTAEAPPLSGSPLRLLASGWRLAGILRAQSGNPVNLGTGLDRALTGIGAGGPNPQRPNQVLPNGYGDRDSLSNYLNPAAFAQPPFGTLGNVGRNAFRAPGRWSMDVALSRLFRLGNGQRLEVRAEAFNVTNNLIKGDPIANLNNPNFGKILSALNPRVLQFAVKYGF